MVILVSNTYRVKDKLVVELPNSVIAALSLKEGDEVTFMSSRDGRIVITKKGAMPQAESQKARPIETIAKQQERQRMAAYQSYQLTEPEISVLKKLDSLRYGVRTKENVDKLLTQQEKVILQGLIKKNAVSLYKKQGEKEDKYGITKSLYDTYLFGKREGAFSKQQVQQQGARVQQRPIPAREQRAPEPQPKRWERMVASGGSNVELLESQGYLVLMNEPEASQLSVALEETIRRGIVVGIRAFNKRFYIALRSFVTKNAPKILKAIGPKGTPVSEISKATAIPEDGVRTVLYILSENGEVTELKRDFFKLVA
jgi:antitoxin component of MazEF toxin-antitoxin module